MKLKNKIAAVAAAAFMSMGVLNIPQSIIKLDAPEVYAANISDMPSEYQYAADWI